MLWMNGCNAMLKWEKSRKSRKSTKVAYGSHTDISKSTKVAHGRTRASPVLQVPIDTNLCI